MGLESGSFISALVSTNPVGATDPKSQGDDHIRFIKAKILETFPNVTGAVTATHAELNLVAGATQGLATLSAQVASMATLSFSLTTSDITGTIRSPILTTTGVSAGTYTAATVVVDTKGRVISISTGTTSDFTTGDVKLTFKTAADTGWVMMNDGTIGDASSGATTRANADTSALFTLLWNNVSDTWCPVSGGRGVSASADFAAHKTITLPRTLGRALAVAGAGSGLTSRALGEYLGEEAHALTQGEVSISLTGSGGGSNPLATGGAAHNNMQPTTFLNVMIKL